MSARKGPRDIAQKFQRDMQKLGLGVTIEVGGKSTVVTWACPSCNHVTAGKPPRCPECGAVA